MILTSNAESLENTEITYRTEAVADGSTYRRVFIAVGLATAGARLRLARPASHSSQDSRSDMLQGEANRLEMRTWSPLTSNLTQKTSIVPDATVRGSLFNCHVPHEFDFSSSDSNTQSFVSWIEHLFWHCAAS
jgi:hypothetical protein